MRIWGELKLPLSLRFETDVSVLVEHVSGPYSGLTERKGATKSGSDGNFTVIFSVLFLALGEAAPIRDDSEKLTGFLPSNLELFFFDVRDSFDLRSR